MKFTVQDAITFGLGLLGAVAPVIAQSFATLDTSKVDELDTWAIGLGAGLATAAGRYLFTRVPEWLKSRGA